MNNRTIYVFPSRSKNKFLEYNKYILSKLDYAIKDVDRSFIFNLIEERNKHFVIINWAEDRMYGRSKKKSLLYFTEMTFFVIFSKMFAKKLIWIRHNFAPHSDSKNHFRYKFLCGLYKFLKVPPVPLESYYSEPSLKHSLYNTDKDLIDSISKQKTHSFSPKNLVLFFGAIKKYKDLHSILEHWPINVQMKIAGYGDDAKYNELITSIIERRKLNISWENKYLSSNELNTMLQDTKFVLLPHANKTMISSGTFYHAISEGCNIITCDTKFGLHKQSQHKFVTIYNPKILNTEYLSSIYLSKALVMQEALDVYGEKKILDSWKGILNDTTDVHTTGVKL